MVFNTLKNILTKFKKVNDKKKKKTVQQKKNSVHTRELEQDKINQVVDRYYKASALTEYTEYSSKINQRLNTLKNKIFEILVLEEFIDNKQLYRKILDQGFKLREINQMINLMLYNGYIKVGVQNRGSKEGLVTVFKLS